MERRFKSISLKPVAPGVTATLGITRHLVPNVGLQVNIIACARKAKIRKDTKSMQMKAEIVEHSLDTYQGKRGQVNTHVLTLLDRSEGTRLKNTVDFMMTDEQASKFPVHENGKLQGKPILVGINEIQAGFGGRMRVKGLIIEFKA